MEDIVVAQRTYEQEIVGNKHLCMNAKIPVIGKRLIKKKEREYRWCIDDVVVLVKRKKRVAFICGGWVRKRIKDAG